MPDAVTSHLPAPLRIDSYRILRQGIYDDPAIAVHVNAATDLAFLAPLPATGYKDYKPRHLTLGLTKYKSVLKVRGRRYEKIAPIFGGVGALLKSRCRRSTPPCSHCMTVWPVASCISGASTPSYTPHVRCGTFSKRRGWP